MSNKFTRYILFAMAPNVIGNTLATSVVAKWEGELAPEHEMQARR